MGHQACAGHWLVHCGSRKVVVILDDLNIKVYNFVREISLDLRIFLKIDL